MLRQFEQALLVMESTPDDAENLNAAFRAAHTIKGTAGLFGCDAVVLFTHEVETLLEGLRSGQLPITEAISAGLLEGLDQMVALLDEVRSGDSDATVAARSQALGQRLRALHGAAPAGPAAAPAQPAASALPISALPASAGPADAGAACWHLSLRFGADALCNGLDPLAFLRYLGGVGTVVDCHTVTDSLPALETLDAESCHLGFEMRLRGDCGQDEIEQVFEFAIDDCCVQVLPPEADAARWQALLGLRSGDDAQARERLLAVWQRQQAGPAASVALDDPELLPETATPVALPGNATAAAKLATIAPAERRQAGAERRGGRDRRPPGETRFVKVRADKLDHLIDLIGELVIAGSGAQMVANQEGSAIFLEATQRVSELVQATRDGALALRMVPVGETFMRFQRVVRDTSKQLAKEIDFIVTGGETELDKSMVELIADPLMHLVRNSLDHGIEIPAERIAAGKPAAGRRPPGRECLPRGRRHRHRGQRRRLRPAPRPHPGQGHRARPAARGRHPQRCRGLAADLRARILHRRQGHRPVGPRCRHGHGQAQHRGAARPDLAGQPAGPRHHHPDPPAADAGDDRRLPHAGGRRALCAAAGGGQ